jgi:hypothetical protein
MRLSIPSAGISAEIPFWVSVDTFLDEELDASPITVENTDIPSPFPRFTVAVLEPDGVPPSYWMIGSDVASTGPNGNTQHVVQLIEPTKWLERFMVGSKTVTQPLYVNYLDSPQVVVGEQPENEVSTPLLPSFSYESPVDAKKEINIYPPYCFDHIRGLIDDRGYMYRKIGISCKVINPDGSVRNVVEQTYEKAPGEEDGPAPNSWKQTSPIWKFTPNFGGVFRLDYELTLFTSDLPAPGHISYSIAAVSATGAKERTLKDAAESMIWAAESLNESETPTFKLKPELAEYLGTVRAPEITVTNANLREALDECAKYVGAITRLDVVPTNGGFEYVVDFEKYCKDTDADLSQLGEPVNTITRSVSCEDYCTALDATAANVVQYERSGTLADPSPQFFRTPRSEDATYRVTEGNASIMTAFPIERIDSLECLLYKDGSPYYLELISYLFESTEYGALSSYQKEYPFSKAYALSYTLGQKNITGLNFTVPNPVHPIFEKPAIVNIINREMKRTYGGNAPQFNNLNALDFTRLLFRVKYVPTGALRVRMRKPNSYGKPESVLAYNQSAAKLDATAFGRAMFGAVLRMGNEITTYQYAPPTFAHVPEKGQRFGEDGYISEVHVEYAVGYKKVTLEVTEGFNRLSQFVGVNKSQRIFEISERMSLDRHIVYEDFCLVGTKAREGSGALVTSEFLEHVRRTFTEEGNRLVGPYINGRGYDEDGNQLVAFVLPAITYGIGNAITFTGSFEDNYGAGRRIDGGKRPSDKEEPENDFYATETDVRYTDLFGRIDKMDFSISDGIGLDIYNVTEAQHLSLANALPQQYDVVEEKHTLLASTSNGKRLVIDKDSRECIKSMTYQISFMEADGVKISPNFAERFLSIGGDKVIRFVPLSHKINNLTEYVDSALADEALNVTKDESSVQMRCTMRSGGVAWAAVDFSDSQDRKSRFLFGKNESFSAGDTINVTLTFFRKEANDKTN